MRARGRSLQRPLVGLIAAVALVLLVAVGHRVLRPKDETAVAPAPVEEPPGGTLVASWKPPTPEELAARPSPLDGRTREQIPAGLLVHAGRGAPAGARAELVAILGESYAAHNEVVSAVLSDPEGKTIITACEKDPVIRVWDLTTGGLLRSFRATGIGSTQPFANGQPTYGLALSRDGRLLAVAGGRDRKGEVTVWDLPTGQRVATLHGHTHLVWNAAFRPDGSQLATAGNDHVLKVWDPKTGAELRSWPLGNHVNDVAFSPDGKRLAAVNWNGPLHIWEANTGEKLLTEPHPGKLCYKIAFSPDGQRLAAALEGGTVTVWDATTGKEQLAFRGHETTSKVTVVAFSPDGKLLASAGTDRTKVWDTATLRAGENTPVSTVVAPPIWVRHIDFTPDSKWLISPGVDGSVEVRDARTGQKRQPRQGHTGAVWAVAVSPDGRTIASGGADGSVRLWDLGAWKPGDPQPPGRALTGHTATVYSVAFSPGGKLVASGSEDGTIRLWDAATGGTVRNLARDSKAPLSDVTFSADGKTLATGEADGSVRLWDVATGEKRSPLRWHTQQVNSAAFSPDGQFLASAGLIDRKVHITDLKTFRRVQTLGPGGDGAAGIKVAFSGDGRTLVYGGWNDTVHLWDLNEKKETVLTGGGPNLDGLAIDPTGRFVAATRGGAVRFWDWTAPTRPLLIGPGPFGTTARSLAFTPEGRYVVVAGANGTVSALRRPALPPDDPSPTPALPPFTNSIGMEFVIVPKGKSWLGGSKEKLGDKQVEIPSDFYLGKYEVTQDEWAQVMGTNPSHFSRTGGGNDAVKDITDADLKRFPVEQVSWDQCQMFVAKLNTLEKETGWVYRLPTEAEWEYACRGGPMPDKLDSAFDFYLAKPTNTLLAEMANFAPEKGKGLQRKCKVGSYEPNRLGLFDVHGNVWEWCADTEKAADGATLRMARTGSWNNNSWTLRAASRSGFPSPNRGAFLGLRLARVPSAAPSPVAKPPQAVDPARALLEARLAKEPQNAALATELADLLLTEPRWTFLKPAEMISEKGATLSGLPDHSVLVSGTNTAGDRYRVAWTVDADIDLAAVRLEALTHDSLPGKGPGRYPGRDPKNLHRGTFAQGGWKVTAALPNREDPITLDFEKATSGTAGQVSPKGDWSIAGKGEGRDCSAVWSLASPVPLPAGTSLTFEIPFGGVGAENLGRFRLSVSADPLAVNRSEPNRSVAAKLTEPWVRLAAAYHILGDQPALNGMIKLHPETAGAVGDLYAAVPDWDRAAAEYLKVVTANPANSALVKKLAGAYQSAGRTRESVAHLAKASALNPNDTILWQTVAVLQAWLGQEEELAATRQRILAAASDTTNADTADRAAKAVCMTPSTDKAELEAALALARTGAKLSKGRAHHLLSLGMAEYRSGHYAAADEALLAAEQADKPPAWLPAISGFYRAMSLFKQGKHDEARKLAAETAATMKPFPGNETNLMAASGPDVVGNRFGDNLILWLTYREAKSVIRFEEVTFANASNLATAYLADRKPDMAVPLLVEVMGAQKSKLGPEHPDALVTVNTLGVAYWQLGQLDKAIPLFEECVKVREAKLGRDHLLTLHVVANLGVTYKDVDRLKEAIPLLEEVHRAAKKTPRASLDRRALARRLHEGG